ncbi:RNA-directed DNA polymerase from transposon X-element, partial [Paramuricea clavata]
DDLLAQPWEQIVLESNTDSMWALWKKLFLEVLDKHAPVQRIRKRKSGVPWLAGEIKKIIFERDKLKREAMVTGTHAAWDKYKSTRNNVNIALRQAKTDYFRTKISNQNNNPKEAWKTINNLLGRSPGNTVVNELKFNDTKITSPEEIANAFNTYFTDIGPNLASSIDDTDITFDRFVKPATSKLTRFKLVSHTKVVKLLNGLSNSKATGLDKISGKILKTAAHTIALSLTHIFNHAIITSCFPYEWKAARLLPLHKKGPRDLPENYRPISILPAIKCLHEAAPRLFADDTTLTVAESGLAHHFRTVHNRQMVPQDTKNSALAMKRMFGEETLRFIKYISERKSEYLQNIPAQDQIHSVTIQQLQGSTNYLSTTSSDASSKKMSVLQTIFGYEKFKGRQEEAIDAILSGSDCLIILPTGAGTTLCYSIPAIIAGGLTVVISPLLSLMLDQVQHLRSKGLNVADINSSVADDDQNTIIHNMVSGNSPYNFVFVTPENVGTEEMKSAFQTIKTNGRLKYIVIDECHCVDM